MQGASVKVPVFKYLTPWSKHAVSERGVLTEATSFPKHTIYEGHSRVEPDVISKYFVVLYLDEW